MTSFVSMSEHQRALDRCEALEAELREARALIAQYGRGDQAALVREALGVYPCCAHLLLALRAAPGRYVSTARLNHAVPSPVTPIWEEPDPARIRVMVKWARKALGSDAIETLYGFGYRLSARGLAVVEGALGQTSIDRAAGRLEDVGFA